MHLTHIVSSVEPRHGGPSVSVPALAAGLARLGERVELLATGPEPAALPSTPGLEVRVFPRGWPEFVGRSSALRRHLAQSPSEVFHSHGLWLRSLHYAHARAAREDAIHVISPRGMMAAWAWNHHRAQKALAAVVVHPGAMAGAQGWHATSEAEAGEIRARGFRQPICIAPNGVEAPAPDAVAAARAHWLAACPAAGRQPTALFYSRLHAKKRVRELVALWAAKAPADWLLLVVGIPEGYTVEELRREAAAAGAGGRIQVFDGAGAPPPYAVASLLLLPSHNENFGLVVAEGLAHGLPALVTDTTPWQPLNATGHGWCVPWAEFGEALRAALAEGPAALRARGGAARTWVLREYSWDSTARLLAGFYRRLLLRPEAAKNPGTPDPHGG